MSNGDERRKVTLEWSHNGFDDDQWWRIYMKPVSVIMVAIGAHNSASPCYLDNVGQRKNGGGSMF